MFFSTYLKYIFYSHKQKENH